MYRLLFQDRDATREPFIPRASRIMIGRDSGCALALAESGVSDRHALLERRSDGYFLRDLGSANGVRVNGTLIEEQRLATGDEIEIGSVRMRFEIVHDSAPTRRTVDLLELIAGGAVAVLIAGQLALLAWIFSMPRPVRGTPIETARSPVQSSPSPATPQASVAPALPPPTMETPAMPLPNVLSRMLKIQRVDRVDGADNVTLKIQVKAQVGERQLDSAAAAVSVEFLAAGEAGLRKPVWLNAPPGWENFSTKGFTARFADPPQRCVGYVVRTYYRKQLQDAVAAPPSLLSAAH